MELITKNNFCTRKLEEYEHTENRKKKKKISTKAKKKILPKNIVKNEIRTQKICPTPSPPHPSQRNKLVLRVILYIGESEGIRYLEELKND